MININLIDWRKKIVVINNNRFYAIAGACVVCVLILTLVVALLVSAMVDAQTTDVKYLEKEVAEIEGKIIKIKDLQKQKDLLMNRRPTIEELQKSSPMVVKIFDSLAKAVPEGVVIKTLTRTADQLVIIGSGDTNSQISTFMKKIAELNWVKSYKLNDITSSAQTSEGTTGTGTNQAVVDNKINFQINVVIDTTLQGGKK